MTRILFLQKNSEEKRSLCQVWLLEVNSNPSMASSKADRRIKERVAKEVFSIIDKTRTEKRSMDTSCDADLSFKSLQIDTTCGAPPASRLDCANGAGIEVEEKELRNGSMENVLDSFGNNRNTNCQGEISTTEAEEGHSVLIKGVFDDIETDSDSDTKSEDGT